MRMNNENSFDIPLGLSMAMAQNPSVFDIFETLDNNERRSLAGLADGKSTDILGRVNGLYQASDSFGRTRMF